MLDLQSLREQLGKEVNVYAIARDEYALSDVDETLDSKDGVIERIVGEEYRLAFL